MKSACFLVVFDWIGSDSGRFCAASLDCIMIRTFESKLHRSGAAFADEGTCPTDVG